MLLKNFALSSRLLDVLVLIAVLVGPSISASAKKEASKEFKASKDVVFGAIMRAVAQDYRLSGSDRDTGIVSFETGSQTWSWKAFKLDARITVLEPNLCRVDLSVRKGTGSMFGWGQAGDIADKFFERVEAEVANRGSLPQHPAAARQAPAAAEAPVAAQPVGTAPSGTPTPPAPASRPNSTPPTEDATTALLKSDPPGADVTVDGKYMGNTPSTVRLTAGDHTIVIEKAGFKTWQRTMTVNPGGIVTIDATLARVE